MNKIALSLSAIQIIPANQIIKTAGILQNIKNFIKKLINPEYKAIVISLQEKNQNIQNIITELNSLLEQIQVSINNANVEEYDIILKQIRGLSKELLNSLSEFQEEGKDVEEILMHYTKEDIKKPDFISKFKKHLPKEYDLEFDKIYNVPIKSFNWYKDLSPDMIFINSQGGVTALSKLLSQVKNTLIRSGFSEAELEQAITNDNLTTLIEIFKNAIVDGNLIYARPKQPTTKITKIPIGQTVISIMTAPFVIPLIGIKLQAEVGLIDLSTTISPRKKLSLQYTKNVTILSKKSASLKNILLKQADGKVKKVVNFQGIKIKIDRPKGFIQEGKDSNGKLFKREYKYDYGFLVDTDGGDDGGLDIFVGPDKGAPETFWVTQKKEDGSFDEYKVFLGFSSKKKAKKAYLKHTPEKYFDSIDSMSIEKMKALLDIPPSEKTCSEETSANRYELLVKISEQIAFEKNTLNDSEFAQALREGYHKIFGSEPSLELLAYAWAQGTTESGRPVNLINNNVGNIKADASWVQSGKKYSIKSTQEFDKTGKPFVHESAKWRAYDSPADGAAGYWQFLKNNQSGAFQWMQAGDPQSATITLGLNSYYTDNIKKYTSAIVKLYDYFIKNIAPNLPGIKSNQIILNAQKPQLKDWLAEYSEEEKHMAKNPQSHAIQKDETDSLMKTLYSGTLANMVKNAIVDKYLPQSKLIISVFCDGNEKEFINKLSCILNEYLPTNNIQRFDNDKLGCDISGNPFIVSRAVQEICDLMSIKYIEKFNKNIQTIVSLG